MPAYTVHAPVAALTAVSAEARATDRFAFVRDGFYFWAFVFGPFWLLYHRLWLAFVGYAVVMGALLVALTTLHAPEGTRSLVFFLIALLMGFEAASLKRWKLSRGKWRQVDVVVAKTPDEAERRFFEKWTAGRTLAADPLSVDRGDPPPTRDVPGQRFSRPPSDDGIIGLFPEPGAPR